MKRITVLAFLTAALISMASARAHAQASAFTVPFDFSVGNQVLPAGSYQVSYYAPKNAIMIRSEDERFHAFTSIQPDDPSTSDSEVIFTKYGNQYFLHEVLCGALSMNVALPTSKLEKRARIHEAHLASAQTQIVAVLRSGAN
jgi:hypothetical protein